MLFFYGVLLGAHMERVRAAENAEHSRGIDIIEIKEPSEGTSGLNLAPARRAHEPYSGPTAFPNAQALRRPPGMPAMMPAINAP